MSEPARTLHRWTRAEYNRMVETDVFQPEAQAKAVTEAFKEASGEAELATKQDIERLKLRMDGEFRLLKWMLGATFAGIIALILKSFF